MQMRPEIQIISMMKAMTDVIIPAVDPTNKLAMEQAQLVVGMLNLMSKQLPVQFAFDRDELARLIDYAGRLKGVPASDSATHAAQAQLVERCEAGADALERCKENPQTLLDGINGIREAIGTLLVALGATRDEPAQLQAEKIIVELSKEQFLRDRAMVAPQGWEPDPAALPRIEVLLGLEG